VVGDVEREVLAHDGEANESDVRVGLRHKENGASTSAPWQKPPRFFEWAS
jgi:hypothetical protein